MKISPRIIYSSRLSTFSLMDNILFASADCDCDCCDGHCACTSLLANNDVQNLPRDYQAPMGELDGLSRTLNTAPFLKMSELPNKNWAICAPTALAPVAVINHSAKSILDFFRQPHSIKEWCSTDIVNHIEMSSMVQVFLDLGFLVSIDTIDLSETIVANSVPTLDTWLFLTRSCNLACTHCYVQKENRHMDLNTGVDALHQIFLSGQKKGCSNVKIKYAGGEPTLRWDLFQALHKEANRLSQQTTLGLTEILVTNGTLLSQEQLYFLKKENIFLSVSVDGFGAGHDLQRPAKTKGSSFENTLSSIIRAVELGIRPSLTITLTTLNLNELSQLTEFALQNQLYLNINLYRFREKTDPLIVSEKDIIQVLQKALQVVESNSPDYPFLEKLLDRSNFGFAHQYACSAGIHYQSIDVDGTVAPCPMLAGEQHEPWLEVFENPKVDDREGCDSCEWRYWCGGGCPVLTTIISGTSKTASPYCGVYKAIYPEIIRLQGLGLLKYLDQ